MKFNSDRYLTALSAFLLLVYLGFNWRNNVIRANQSTIVTVEIDAGELFEPGKHAVGTHIDDGLDEPGLGSNDFRLDRVIVLDEPLSFFETHNGTLIKSVTVTTDSILVAADVFYAQKGMPITAIKPIGFTRWLTLYGSPRSQMDMMSTDFSDNCTLLQAAEQHPILVCSDDEETLINQMTRLLIESQGVDSNKYQEQ